MEHFRHARNAKRREPTAGKMIHLHPGEWYQGRESTDGGVAIKQGVAQSIFPSTPCIIFHTGISGSSRNACKSSRAKQVLPHLLLPINIPPELPRSHLRWSKRIKLTREISFTQAGLLLPLLRRHCQMQAQDLHIHTIPATSRIKLLIIPLCHLIPRRQPPLTHHQNFPPTTITLSNAARRPTHA